MANFRIYNETLCPYLWDEAQHLNPKVRANLLQMAYDFYEKTKFPAPIIDVYFMGSAANYNWNAESDVDVHVIIDYTKLQMPPEAAIKAVKTAAQQWNAEHNVMVKGHKVEMNLQNFAEQKPYVTGIYSLVKDQWIRKPFKMPLRIDRNVFKIQYGAMKGYVQNAINSKNREKMKAAKKYLDAYRQYGLDTYGELSYENLVFKILRSRGLIKQLKDGIVSVYDQEMTVKESDYIGSTFSGKAKGSPVANALGTVHDEHDMISGVNSQNWRYLERKNKVLWNTKPSPEDVREVTQWLLRQGVKNPIHKVMHKEGVTEVGEKDIKQTLPNLNVADNPKMGDPRFDRSYWDKMNKETGVFRIQRLTMDELNALREKEIRAVAYCQTNKYPTHEILHRKLFARYDNELNRRKRKINAPVTEGFGAGIPEDDRLKIKNTDGSTRRWQVRSKDAPKTPKMTAEIVKAIPESDFEDGQPLPPMNENISTSTPPTIKKFDESRCVTECLMRGLILESPEMKTLKKGRRQLSDEERKIVMDADATWHHGPKGEETPAVWKSVVKGKTWYVCNTHRAMQVKPTLKGAIQAFKFIKTTS